MHQAKQRVSRHDSGCRWAKLRERVSPVCLRLGAYGPLACAGRRCWGCSCGTVHSGTAERGSAERVPCLVAGCEQVCACNVMFADLMCEDAPGILRTCTLQGWIALARP